MKFLINENQYKNLIGEGITWNSDGDIPSLSINHHMTDKANKGKMSVDTRVFGSRNDILNGDNTLSSHNKNLEQFALTRRAALNAYANLISYIKNGRNGKIFTDNNLDKKIKTTILGWLDNYTDDEILAKSKNAIERLKFNSQVYFNTYDRVNNALIQGTEDKVARYNVLTIPNTEVKCIALFTMTDFNFSDAIKHGYLRQNSNTDSMMGIESNERSKTGKVYSSVPITYDNGIKPDVSQNFSLKGFDIDNYPNISHDHYKQNYQYQGGMYNTSEMGYDDLERELRKPKNYTSINQFIDKSIMYASYALKKEDFYPQYIITVPSSSKFNKYYSINLSNKLGCKYIPDFFRKNLINVRWNGKDVYDEMINNGFTESEILKFEIAVKKIAYNEIAYQIEKKVYDFSKEYDDILSNISIKKNSREKFSKRDVVLCICKYAYETLKMARIANDVVSNHLISNFYNQIVTNTDKHLYNSILSLITLKIGKRKFSELLEVISELIIKYSSLLKENGYNLTFGNKPFRATMIDKKARPYLNGIYIVADEFLSKKDGYLLTSLKNAKIVIFDEDINSGASMKLCIDAFKEKIPEGSTRNLLGLTNAYSDSGR